MIVYNVIFNTFLFWTFTVFVLSNIRISKYINNSEIIYFVVYALPIVLFLYSDAEKYLPNTKFFMYGFLITIGYYFILLINKFLFIGMIPFGVMYIYFLFQLENLKEGYLLTSLVTILSILFLILMALIFIFKDVYQQIENNIILLSYFIFNFFYLNYNLIYKNIEVTSFGQDAVLNSIFVLWIIFTLFVVVYIYTSKIKYRFAFTKEKRKSEYDSIKFILKDYFNLNEISNRIEELSDNKYMTKDEVFNTLLEMTALEISIYYPSFLEIYTSYEEEINKNLTKLFNEFQADAIFLKREERRTYKNTCSYNQNLFDFFETMDKSMLPVLYEDIILKVFLIQFNLLKDDLENRKNIDNEAAEITRERLLKGLREDSEYYIKQKEGTSPNKE